MGSLAATAAAATAAVAPASWATDPVSIPAVVVSSSASPSHTNMSKPLQAVVAPRHTTAKKAPCSAAGQAQVQALSRGVGQDSKGILLPQNKTSKAHATGKPKKDKKRKKKKCSASSSPMRGDAKCQFTDTFSEVSDHSDDSFDGSFLHASPASSSRKAPFTSTKD